MDGSDEPLLDLNGEPFSDFDRATALRDVLIQETRRGYRVDRGDKENEFVVRRVKSRDSVPGRRRLDDRNGDRFGEQSGARPDSGFTPIILRPSLRTSLPFFLPFILLGVFLIQEPFSMLSFLISVSGIGSLPRVAQPEALITGIRIIGVFLLLPSLRSVLQPWMSSRYVVAEDGVSMEHGIIARDGVQIRYRDIRSTSISQGIIERLLNVGTVQFAAAGTDEVDVSFQGIARPGKVRAYVEQRMDEHR